MKNKNKRVALNKIVLCKKVKKVISKGNKIALFFGLWFLFLPIPYKPLIVINILIPIIAIYLAVKYKGIYIMDTKKAVHACSFSTMVLMPSIALTVRGMFDYQIDYNNKFLAYVLIFGVISSIFILTNTTWGICYKSPKITISLFVMLYCFGFAQQVNCGIYNTREIIHNTAVVDKTYFTKYKGNTEYYLYVEPFGKYKDNQSINVSSKIYFNINKNDIVKVITYKGMLGIDWYILDYNTTS